MKQRKQRKHNPIAKQLASPQYRQRIVERQDRYCRKRANKQIRQEIKGNQSSLSSFVAYGNKPLFTSSLSPKGVNV